MAITLNGTTGITTPDVDSTDLTATGNFTSRGIDDNATSTAMTLDSSGNVGIGTSSPITKLHAYDASTDAVVYVDSGNANGAHMRFLASGSVKHFVGSGGGFGLGDVDDYAIRSYDNILFSTGNSSTERMRLDTSGNLLVGKTSGSIAVQGFAVQPSGQTKITESGADVLRLNRLSSDGTIIDLRKDGSTVGSIGSSTNIAGNFYIAGSASAGLQFRSDDILPTNGAGSYTNGSIDLGDNGARFRNGHFSGAVTAEGGVYLGGTGSANHLDDYEEGTWLVEMFDASTGGNKSASNATGYYTKIGRLVHITFSKYNLSNAGMTGAGAVWISLPFTPTGETVSGSINVRQFSFPSTVEYLVPQPAVGLGRFVIQMVRSGNTSTEVTWANISNTITDIGSLSITYMA